MMHRVRNDQQPTKRPILQNIMHTVNLLKPSCMCHTVN